jgi:hypothetical protein
VAGPRRRRHEQLDLSQEEAAFYDALAGGVEDVKADPELATLAHELVEAIRTALTVDWTDRESAEANPHEDQATAPQAQIPAAHVDPGRWWRRTGRLRLPSPACARPSLDQSRVVSAELDAALRVPFAIACRRLNRHRVASASSARSTPSMTALG